MHPVSFMRRLWFVLVACAACSSPSQERPTVRVWDGMLVGQQLGGIVGGALTGRMDETDRHRAGAALERAQMHETRTWINRDTGTAWEITPFAQSGGGEGPCRQFALSAQDGLEDLDEAYGTACREPDGDWRITG